MAVTVGSRRGSGGSSTSGTPQTTSATFSSTPTSGCDVLLSLLIPSASRVPTAVTDTRGNTWVQLALAPDTGTNIRVALWAAFNQSGLVASDVVTVTWSGAGTLPTLYALDEVDGLRSTTTPEQTATGFSTTNVSAVSVGPTAATTTADTLDWCVIGTNVTNIPTQTLTPGSGYTQQGARVTSTAGSLYVEYQIVSSTGTQSATGTLNTTTSKYAALLSTLPGPAAAASARRPAVQVIA